MASLTPKAAGSATRSSSRAWTSKAVIRVAGSKPASLAARVALKVSAAKPASAAASGGASSAKRGVSSSAGTLKTR